ncbi:hypothetical protein J8273_1854 [Carpediemonas membranifera]|uniref:Uncharacterized protein n=1 Tax=Carpediemonas membranifera TaxID=201153 RepID=A0A8J6AWT2_9EUKA|nr:hypothetical protein J8273_1854 [Carpediemonas membranifera]|eukprot:KAG9396811.1 hypothetical protein J8273_1854 [Carpediemonas membranifera]
MDWGSLAGKMSQKKAQIKASEQKRKAEVVSKKNDAASPVKQPETTPQQQPAPDTSAPKPAVPQPTNPAPKKPSFRPSFTPTISAPVAPAQQYPPMQQMPVAGLMPANLVNQQKQRAQEDRRAQHPMPNPAAQGYGWNAYVPQMEFDDLKQQDLADIDNWMVQATGPYVQLYAQETQDEEFEANLHAKELAQAEDFWYMDSAKCECCRGFKFGCKCVKQEGARACKHCEEKQAETVEGQIAAVDVAAKAE